MAKDIDRICIIGCGKMGEACLAGWLNATEGAAASLSSSSFVAVEPNPENQERISSKHGVKCVDSVADLAFEDPFDLVLLSVKPQVLPAVLEELSNSGILGCNGSSAEGAGVRPDSDDDPRAGKNQHSNMSLDAGKGPLILSIAAGIATEDIASALPEGVHVVRAMPNMPLQVCQGATVVCAGPNASDSDLELARSLFDDLGVCFVVDEPMIDAVCAISGGGPAYVAYMVEALRDAGVALGLDADLAQTLAFETVGGTYSAMKASGVSPEDMRISVCSPGGTTLAAIGSMDDDGFKPMFAKAMKAAVDRAEELREGK